MTENSTTRAQLVAARIRTMRTGRNLPLSEISLRVAECDIRLSVGQLSRIELGQRKLDLDELTAIADALTTTPEHLMRAGELCPTCLQEINK